MKEYLNFNLEAKCFFLFNLVFSFSLPMYLTKNANIANIIKIQFYVSVRYGSIVKSFH